MTRPDWKRGRQRWEPCPGYEEVYQVSSHGLVRRSAPGPGTWIGKIKKQQCPPSLGRWTVKLWRNEYRKGPTGTRLPVAPLICEAFHGPAPSSKHCAAHIDGNPKRNDASNLRWELKREMGAHQRVLSEHERDMILEDYGRISAEDLARRFSVGRSTIYRVWKGSRKIHGNRSSSKKT